MDLTDEEYRRLVLANQYEILSKLEPEEKAWSSTLEKVVRGFPLGDAPNLGLIREYISEPFTERDVALVHGALDLYAVLQSALDGSPDEHLASFPGFDGNNETGALTYMRIVREEDRWTYVKPTGTDAINSHHPTYRMYRRQIEKWEALGKPYPLTPEQAKEILTAA